MPANITAVFLGLVSLFVATRVGCGRALPDFLNTSVWGKGSLFLALSFGVVEYDAAE
jgi:hypothetical protein